MKGLNKFPEEYFLKYKTNSVKLRPYDPKQEQVGKIYMEKIKAELKEFQVKLMVRGSTAFKILGKGEVEVGVYPQAKDWDRVTEKLKVVFGEPENVEDNYARFNDRYEDVEIEIILLTGHEADVDIKLHAFMINHPDTLKKYEAMKKKYSFSKREYQRQKSHFLSEIIENI